MSNGAAAMGNPDPKNRALWVTLALSLFEVLTAPCASAGALTARAYDAPDPDHS